MSVNYRMQSLHFIITVIILVYIEFVYSSCINCTENPMKFTDIVSRKKRYLIFLPGSTVICTLSVVKAVVFTSPSGHNIVMEADFNYPLPDKVVLPQKKHPKPVVSITTAKPTVGPVDHHNEFDFFEHYEPQSQNHFVNLLSNNIRRKSDKGIFPSKSRYNHLYSKYQTSSKSRKRNKFREKRHSESFRKPLEDNYHHNGHRERRNLYKSIEEFINGHNIGLDGRSCILRTICEAQHWLLPKGKSLFHDIFRVLFSLPSEGHPEDHYKAAMSHEEEDCSLYEEKCPISILSFILTSEKII
ncbi:uncharacterized protein LOC129810179 [Phlebotomus papatasi]|uniref:uncharacterized protein LOC129810179 n=1 Tax=Phlebotomus papatasi TaxID=29031 RepID=UPI002483B7E7|nr:uncharacterized protein LOC129810179 [Phlebotomus papatasi]